MENVVPLFHSTFRALDVVVVFEFLFAFLFVEVSVFLWACCHSSWKCNFLWALPLVTFNLWWEYIVVQTQEWHVNKLGTFLIMIKNVLNLLSYEQCELVWLFGWIPIDWLVTNNCDRKFIQGQSWSHIRALFRPPMLARPCSPAPAHPPMLVLLFACPSGHLDQPH